MTHTNDDEAIRSQMDALAAPDDEIKRLRTRCAECDCGDGDCTWIASGPAEEYEECICPAPCPIHHAPDAVARLAEAITPAPQPEAATPTAQEAVPVDLSHGWLIHKAGRGWYRPNAKGYTGCIAEAGRYSHEDALDYSHPNGLDGPRDNITIKHESDATTTRSDLCASGQVRVVAQAALASRAAHPPQISEMIAAVERAFDEIRELNMSGRDENGHRWANSDLIDQTVTEGLVALRALKGGA